MRKFHESRDSANIASWHPWNLACTSPQPTSSQRIVVHERRGGKGTAARTARPAAGFVLELHLLARPLRALALVPGHIVLVEQMLGQLAADGRQCVADLGHDQGQEAGLAAAQAGDEREQGVEVFLGTGLELAGFERHARHDVDEGAGYVEDLFNLWKWC